MEYPKIIMQNILWSFSKPQYETLEDFSKDLIAYNEEITGEDFDIELYKPILFSNKVVVKYMFYNEEEEEIEPSLVLDADNDRFFTIEELLFKVHNKVHKNLIDADNIFFEGFILWEGENPNYPDLPLYFLLQGS